MKVTRVGDGPIIDPDLHPSIGTNIQGPALVRVPEWVDDPLGRYYLYFADHKGSFIRMAYADDLLGPWTIHPPGALALADTHFLTEPPTATEEQLAVLRDLYRRVLGDVEWSDDLLVDALTPHIASPDVHVDHAARRFVMYFHGLSGVGWQVTRAATSTDGLGFAGREEVIGRPYLRAFNHDDMTYALTMPGVFVRSHDGLGGFEEGPTLFEPAMRHSAVLVRDGVLHVFWTRVGDAPESILRSTVDLAGDWSTWSATEPMAVLRPEYDWEGADLTIEPSKRGAAHRPMNELRDPAVFDEGGRTYLLYSVAGESGIALAEIDWTG